MTLLESANKIIYEGGRCCGVICSECPLGQEDESCEDIDFTESHESSELIVIMLEAWKESHHGTI